MRHDEIIETAAKAGITYRGFCDEFATGNGDGVEIEQMQVFTKLIAAHEAEECAQMVEQMGIEGYGTLAIAAAIRQRHSK